MDEPSAELPPHEFEVIVTALADLQRATGLSWVVITHDFGLALRWCTRSVVLNRGQVAFDGQTSTLARSPSYLDDNRIARPRYLPVLGQVASALNADIGTCANALLGFSVHHAIDGVAQ